MIIGLVPVIIVTAFLCIVRSLRVTVTINKVLSILSIYDYNNTIAEMHIMQFKHFVEKLFRKYY